MAKKKLPEKKEDKKILGITANIKNIVIAVAMLFAFVGGFFQIYNWLECTYGKKNHLEMVEALNDLRWETTVLNGMYSRFCSLEPIMKMAISPTSIPQETMKEYNELRTKIPLQEAKVKLLQEKSMRKE